MSALECLMMYTAGTPVPQSPAAASRMHTRTPSYTDADCHDHWACEAYGRVCPSASRNAGRSARRALERISRDSELLEEHSGDAAAFNAAAFTSSDIIIGRLLGRGGFSEVHEARLTPSYLESTGAAAGMESDDDATKEPRHRYVVKYLRRSAMVDRKKFARGAADLVIEASLLSALDHPNIIRLLGITAGPVEENFASGKDHGFFLLLDRLYDTLDDKIEGWKEVAAKYSGFVYRATHDPRGCKRRAALLDRLRVAHTLAGAVKYLHEKNVAFRDLKPENIGFDGHGVLKLFDFGLAKELKASRRLADGTYQLTGNTGSRRYMAPEVALVKPYNLSVDSYSFGILLWEMCSLDKPFQGYTETNHRELIVEGGERPPLDSHGAHSFWPHTLFDLIGHCWAQDMRERPSFVDIIEVLGNCLDDDHASLDSSGRGNKTSRKKRVGSFVRNASGKLSSTSEKHSRASTPSDRHSHGGES